MRIYRRPSRLQPVGPLHRAIAYQQWSATGVDAQIHAILGGNPTELCNLAGRMFFTILGASITEKLDPEDRDIRIVRGAVNAVYDQVDATEISPANRASILSGLEAVKRLASAMKQRSIVDSHFDLINKLRTGHVNYSDFERLIAEAA
jgi:hypothetical protein